MLLTSVNKNNNLFIAFIYEVVYRDVYLAFIGRSPQCQFKQFSTEGFVFHSNVKSAFFWSHLLHERQKRGS